jgi:hypothetical protein
LEHLPQVINRLRAVTPAKSEANGDSAKVARRQSVAQ